MHWAGKTCFKYSSHFDSLLLQGVIDKVVIVRTHNCADIAHSLQLWVLTITTLSITPCRSKGIKIAAIRIPSPMHMNPTKI